MVNGFAAHRCSPKLVFLRESPPLIREAIASRDAPKAYVERLMHARA
jgi:hypothetical protein